MSEPIVTDVTETIPDITSTEKVAIVVAVASAAVLGVVYYRARRKLKAMEAKEESSVHVVTDLEDETPKN